MKEFAYNDTFAMLDTGNAGPYNDGVNDTKTKILNYIETIEHGSPERYWITVNELKDFIKTI